MLRVDMLLIIIHLSKIVGPFISLTLPFHFFLSLL